ncbi:hypothetical protein MRX96_011856 [Rhipicephalus microplus]
MRLRYPAAARVVAFGGPRLPSLAFVATTQRETKRSLANALCFAVEDDERFLTSRVAKPSASDAGPALTTPSTILVAKLDGCENKRLVLAWDVRAQLMMLHSTPLAMVATAPLF